MAGSRPVIAPRNWLAGWLALGACLGTPSCDGDPDSPLNTLVLTSGEGGVRDAAPVPPLPDLVVLRTSFSAQSLTPGSAIRFLVTVQNVGRGSTPEGSAVRASFYDEGGTLLGQTDDATTFLAAGDVVNLVARDPWIAVPGPHTVRAVVDEANSIREGNENNNTGTLMLPIEGADGAVPSDGGSVEPPSTPADAALESAIETGTQPDAPALPCSVPVAIDGALAAQEWPSSWTSISKSVMGGKTTRHGEFQARWDTHALYLAVRVFDDSLHNDSDDVWQDSAVEVCVDLDHDRATTYGADDFQVILGWRDTQLWGTSSRVASTVFAQSRTSFGYVMEFAFPFEDKVPAIGTVLGIDVQVDLDEDGGDRDVQLAWNGTAEDYKDTSHFGDLTLEGTCSAALLSR